jgi:hypothetical protein
MGKLEGLIIIVIALVVLWIGITGRAEAVTQAIGLIRKPPSTPGKVPAATVAGPLDVGLTPLA